MTRTNNKSPDKSQPGATKATGPVAKPKRLEKPGQHGPQRRPHTENSLTRLLKLLKLSTDVSPTTVLREAADEIEALRRGQPPSGEVDDE